MALPNQGQPTDDFWATNAPPSHLPWWEDPNSRPAGYTGVWPPPLPDGATYGAAVGSIAIGGQSGAPGSPVGSGGAYAGPGAHYDEQGNPTYIAAPAAAPPPPARVTTPGGPGPIGPPASGFGAYPAPYASDPNAPQYQPLPAYKPPTWTGGDYVNPTEGDLLAMPGYQVGLDAGLLARQRSAAAQGTILSGGTQKGLTRYGNDYATTNYQTLRNNTLDAYKQRYAQFTDAAGMDLGARTINANETQNTFQNRLSTYNTGNARTLSEFLTNLTAKRNAETDFWNRLNDLNQTGSGLAGGSR